MTPMPEPSTPEAEATALADEQAARRWLAFVASYPMPIAFASCEEETCRA